MENKLRKIRRQLSTLLALCMVFTLTIVNVPVFGEENNGVTVTYVPSMLWGGLKQYVEYEMDGIKYRTDWASSATNRLAWSRMTQEQRRQTYDRLHTTAARKAAFGEDGFADIVRWIRETNEWFVANRVWKDRIANRDFPELYQVYNKDASLSTLYSDYDQLNITPENVARHLEKEKFDKALADVEQTYEIGRQYYQKVVDMRGKNIGAVASFTMMQCTQMLSDMLFVPSVVQGATVATSGMFADVTNVLLQVVKLDGGSIAEKVESAMAGHPVQLSLGEQIKLREAVIETYRRLAEKCKNELDMKMSDLRFAHRQLKELSELIESHEQQLAEERQQAKENYQAELDEIFISPTPKEPGEDDEIYITLAFKWKTEAELRWNLFKNDFDNWRTEKSTAEDSSGYLAAAEVIFDEVLAQKAVLDQEVLGKVSLISSKLVEAYNKVNDKLEALEAEISLLKDRADSDLPEDELDLTRIPVGVTFFYGTDSFSPGLENFANSGIPYDDYYGELQIHISAYQSKVEVLLESVNNLKDRHEGFYASIETDVQNVVDCIDLLKKLGENYQALYGDAVWQIRNDLDVDISPNYDNCPQINPYNDEAGEKYRANGFLEAIEKVDLPEEVYDPDVSAAEAADVLAVARPTAVFDQAYTLYQYLIEIKEELEGAHSDSLGNDSAYKAGRTKYYEEMDTWLAEYKAAEQKMAGALADIKSITGTYEALWEGTYFLGSYNTSNMYPYLYNTSLVYLSAFDVEGLRKYIRNGGNTATLHNKLKDIARKAEENEVVVADLIGRIGALKIEMEQLWNSTLVDYAVNKGTPVKNFYTLRSEYDLDDKWGNLVRSSEDVLAYFNICDIPQICDILKGETDDVIFLKNAIKEIRGYLDASSIATVPVSNRLYDIYRKATGIKDLYMSSAYTNYGLMTEEQHTVLLNLYANPGDADDISNTINDVKHKHEGVNYTYPPSQHEGVDDNGPVGDPTPNASLPGMIAVQAPIYHPLAAQATSITATLYVWDDGWSILQTLSGTEGSLGEIIDPTSDMLIMPFTGLEDGREYRVDWDIVHAPYGTALHEEGNYYFTYTAPVGIFTTVDLNKDTYDSADVTVTNNSGSELSNQYVFLDGYDENENLVLTERRPLSNLDTGKTTKVEFTFDEVVYTVQAYVAEENGQTPEIPVDGDVDVDWSEVEDKIGNTSYTYGDRDDKAGTLGEGTATAGDIPLQGTFSYKNPARIMSAGEQAITVVFTVTTTGDYQGLQLEYDVPVTVAKREITGTMRITGRSAVGETLTAVFTSEIDPEEYNIVWLSGGNTVATAATYTVTAEDRGRTINVKAVGKRNYTGEVAGETGISIPPAIPETPGTGSSGGVGSPSKDTSLTQKEKDMDAKTTSGTNTTNLVERVRVEAYVETAERGSEIVIPISENDTSTAQLSLNTIETMAEREMTLTVESDIAAISIPSNSIDIGAVKALFGKEAEDGDIPISITISQLPFGEMAALHSAAESERLEILGTPVVFSVSASYNGKAIEVLSFKKYVQRRLEVTQEVAENVSTALVFEEDDTFRSVPTSVCLEDGKYYVIVASRTNSTYVLVSQTVSFNDTDGRWYEDAAKEMASRQIIRGIDNSTFAGNRVITRAEFAAIIVRALGLPAKDMSVFSDVPKDAWYNGAVAAAAKYEIVSGRCSNRFDPMAKITREEAMQMVFNASKLTPFSGVEGTVNNEAFSDYKAKSQWAAEAVDFNLSNGLIVGSNGKINPKANITRGEVAAVVLRLLRQSKLVNDGAEI